MQVQPRQKTIIENIVTLHETGRISAKSYGQLTNVRGDPGGLTYGKHQVTINSGGLYLMLTRYCNAPGAAFANDIKAFLPSIRQKLNSVASSPVLTSALTKAGDDPVMQHTQDQYFDDQYWNPAVKFCDAKGLDYALSMGVVYDSTIHGSLYRIAKRVPAGLDDPNWILSYTEARRAWFINSPNPILRRCTYRMDTFKALLDARNYDLHSPVMVHGRRADVGLPDAPPLTVEEVSAPPVQVPLNSNTQRIIDIGDRGADVQELQNMLVRIGYADIHPDGVFGQKTLNAVVHFQKLYNLTPDGIVGPSTWRVLDQVDD